jgi:ribosomal-protein-alanine N-acetyltransferase
MSAAVLAAPPAPAAAEARLEPMTGARLDAVLAIEQAAHRDPWTRRHFTDTLAAGHWSPCLLGGDTLLGYCVAMPGVQEAHLLNLTVAPAFQRQGWARLMLDALALWARGQGAEQLWLEVRASNARAQQVYRQRGFVQAGLRKGYYRLGRDQREDAVVMRLGLERP